MGTEARRNGGVPARPKIAVIFISDRPERYMELRHSALAGRAVHIWLDGGREPPSWATGLHGDPIDASTYSTLQGREAIVIVDLADTERAEAVARAVCQALPLPAVLLIDRQRGRRHAGVRDGITWIDEGKLLADAIELVLRRLAARKRLQGLKRALRGSKSCTFLVQNDPDPDAIASALALRQALRFEPAQSPIVSCGYVTRPENLRLLEELDEHVRHLDSEQLAELTPLVLVDVQPPYFSGTLPEVAPGGGPHTKT